MAQVEFVVTLMDIEEDACRSVLRRHVAAALQNHLPYITSEVTCEDY